MPTAIPMRSTTSEVLCPTGSQWPGMASSEMAVITAVAASSSGIPAAIIHIISDTGDIQIMAEMGVILLLFTIGLEVNPASLYKMKKLLLYSGGFRLFFQLYYQL